MSVAGTNIITVIDDNVITPKPLLLVVKILDYSIGGGQCGLSFVRRARQTEIPSILGVRTIV